MGLDELLRVDCQSLEAQGSVRGSVIVVSGVLDSPADGHDPNGGRAQNGRARRPSIRQRSALHRIGKRRGRKALREVACIAKPDTILAWYRRLIARKFDGTKHRQYPGRPKIGRELEALVVRMARENSGWGYDRIVGAMANLGYRLSDQTVGNILRRHGIAPAPKRSRTISWKDFIAAHVDVLAGADYFTVEVLRWRNLVGPTMSCFSSISRAVRSA
jgi:hypothetical protein